MQSERLETECLALEEQFKDAVQVDFEISEGTLSLGLPTPLVRSPGAAVAIASSLVREGAISKSEALLRVQAHHLRQMLLPSFSEAEVRQVKRQGRLLSVGVESTGGAVTGVLASDTASAWDLHQRGESVIFCCEQLTYRERDVLAAVSGLVVTGGAILAASQFERPCVVVPGLKLVEGRAQFSEQGILGPGDMVSLDGATGEIFAGALAILPGRLSDDALTLLSWADEVRTIDVRANVSSVEDVEQAVSFLAAGVGLCRIECLFQQPDRLPLFQEALKEICVGAAEETSSTLEVLADAVEEEAFHLFRACLGFSEGAVTVRLLDAPVSSMMKHWRDHGDLPADYFEDPMLAWMQELNPMHGLRCGRLSLMFPVLMRLQIRALLRAWNRVAQSASTLKLQFMMPGVTDAQEVRILRECVRSIAHEECLEAPDVGSMLELPRACLTADALCEEADFLSFGTGDLTEATCGMSRYDAQLSFLPNYLDRDVFWGDPFQAIDQPGVGALMRLAADLVKKKYPTYELGTCGAQAIDAKSLEFCCQIGLRSVSVPAHHVPVARLVAAQAALSESL